MYTGQENNPNPIDSIVSKLATPWPSDCKFNFEFYAFATRISRLHTATLTITARDWLYVKVYRVSTAIPPDIFRAHHKLVPLTRTSSSSRWRLLGNL